jgi:hypothetical protein
MAKLLSQLFTLTAVSSFEPLLNRWRILQGMQGVREWQGCVLERPSICMIRMLLTPLLRPTPRLPTPHPSTPQNAGITFAGVHDSFWTHAGSVAVMNKVLRDKFVELHTQQVRPQRLQAGVTKACLGPGAVQPTKIKK